MEEDKVQNTKTSVKNGQKDKTLYSILFLCLYRFEFVDIEAITRKYEKDILILRRHFNHKDKMFPVDIEGKQYLEFSGNIKYDKVQS